MANKRVIGFYDQKGKLVNPPHEVLTKRESAVLHLLATGQNRKQIAQSLGMGLHSVNTFMERSRVRFRAAGFDITTDISLYHAMREIGMVK